jgi:hypothetical protein
MNKDATNIDITAQRRASSDSGHQMEGAMPFAYVILGALAFPVVLITALASGMQLLMSGLVALVLSGPVALILYLALAVASSRSS